MFHESPISEYTDQHLMLTHPITGSTSDDDQTMRILDCPVFPMSSQYRYEYIRPNIKEKEMFPSHLPAAWSQMFGRALPSVDLKQWLYPSDIL
jgi:hypothetical protein